jgi:hypothetical protein
MRKEIFQYCFMEENIVDISSLPFFFTKFIYICSPGEMAEWSKAHAWKVCNRQKRFMGSNPILSAIFLFFNHLFFTFDFFRMPKKIPFNFMMIFDFFMILVYVGLGFYFIFYRNFNARFGIPKEYSGLNIFFGIFLIIYGVFRFVRVYPKISNKKNHENE